MSKQQNIIIIDGKEITIDNFQERVADVMTSFYNGYYLDKTDRSDFICANFTYGWSVWRGVGRTMRVGTPEFIFEGLNKTWSIVRDIWINKSGNKYPSWKDKGTQIYSKFNDGAMIEEGPLWDILFNFLLSSLQNTIIENKTKERIENEQKEKAYNQKQKEENKAWLKRVTNKNG